MSSLLETIAFRQPRRAQGEIAALAGGLPSVTQTQIEALLASAADPDAALHYLASLKHQYPDAFKRLVQSQTHLQQLIAVFSNSRFLSDEILQNPQWIEQLDDLDRVLLDGEYKKRLIAFLKHQPEGTPEALSLALFRRQQILRILLRDILGLCALSRGQAIVRILLRDILGLCALSETTEELSNLADAILDVSYERIRAELVSKHGVPRYVDEDGKPRECGMSDRKS